MASPNGDSPHKSATVLPPVGRPFAAGHDPRRNAGGRPRGLSAAAHAVVGDERQAERDDEKASPSRHPTSQTADAGGLR